MEGNSRRTGRLLFLIVAFAAWPLATSAQTTGMLRGLVTDLTGAPLAGVTIAVSSSTQAARGQGAITDASGSFQIPALPPGHDYQVRASFPGLATVVVSDVAVAAGRVRTLDLIMQPETDLRERVDVRAAPQVINPESTSTETRLSAEFIDALPIFGRNYQDVLTLAPGVTDVDGDGNPNIHGARDTNVVTLLDGVSTNDPLTGKVGVQLNLEAIQEIEVKTAGATAEFSRAQGGFANVITKSGGNEFEGTFKFFWRGSLLDGDGAGIDDPRLHAGVGEVGLRDLNFNDFLPFLTLGGPIIKDRAWFFVALEYIQKEDPVNAVNAAFVTGLREHREFAKATWQVSPNHRLALTLNYDPQEFLNQGLNSFTREESGFTLRQGGLLLSLKNVSVFNPSAALETTVAHFKGRPDLLPNLGIDTNGNGETYFDRNDDKFFEARERDPGEDYDGDGRFDVFEDTLIRNGKIDVREVPDPDDPFNTILFSEDQDGDGRLTPPGACEGNSREDLDCDGHLDTTNEDINRNGRLDLREDLDGDGRLDFGTEDRNGNGLLDDLPFPELLYPYGRLKPEVTDRDYTIQQSSGIVRGPYFEEYADRRARLTLRQDLSLFVPEFRGTHDFRLGYVIERESFDRRTDARDILLERDEIPPVCFPSVSNPLEETCIGGLPPSVVALLPTERSLGGEATGRTVGLYVHNTYKPLPNLSLSLGVRFDRETADAAGYSFFDPRTETLGSERILALGGSERGSNDLFRGNGDGITSQGIFSDPLFADASDPRQPAGGLIDGLRLAALQRQTQHRSSIGFTLGRFGALFPDIIQDGGEVDFDRLTELGFSFQQPKTFAISNNNLAPRLSVSWDPWFDGRTKLFATWGRYYDKLFLSTIVGEQGIERIARYYLQDPVGLDVSGFTAHTGQFIVTSATPNHHIGRLLSKSPPSVTQVDRGLQTPWSDEFTLGFEREIAPEVAFSLRYISRRFRQQLQDIDINHTVRIDPSTGEPVDTFGILVQNFEGDFVPAPDGRPDLYIRNFFFNQVLRVTNANEARYSALEAEVVKRLSRRWELQGSYTYSRVQGDAEDFQSRLGNDPSTVESEFGYLDFDQRHVVKLNVTTFLPGDWQLGIAASWSSGLPFSVISRFFALDNIGYEQFRTRFGTTARDPEHGGFRFIQQLRNSERNHSVYDLNLRAKKSLVIGRTSAAVFLEVFNVLNTDDLRIFTFEPNRTGGVASGSSATLSTPLQLDATRRFGRRFQVGFQFNF